MVGTRSKIYWKKVFGVELFKVRYFTQKLLYRFARITLPKIRDQKEYWRNRGEVYMDEILASGYLEREIFFQDMLFEELNALEFNSIFEAGCGFGWNVKRARKEFPHAQVGGLDFSLSQLTNSRRYLDGAVVPMVNGDNSHMPFKDKAFDVGFSLGVFMNIHPSVIGSAIREMIRVCRKYILHVEYDANNTTPELRGKRAFKTNIVSHDYRALYEGLGLEVLKFSTYADFAESYRSHEESVMGDLNRWEGFEGPEKYIFIVVRNGNETDKGYIHRSH